MKCLDKILETLAMDQSNDFDKNIEKIIDRRIQKIALKTFLIIVLIAVLLILVLNPITSLIFTNPAAAAKGKDSSKLLKTYQAYYESNYPYIECASVEVKKHGFSRYTIYPSMVDHRGPTTIELGSDDPEFKMKFGKTSTVKDTKGFTCFLMHRFDYGSDGKNDLKYTTKDKSDTITQISQLPKSSWLYISVSSKKLQNIGDLKKINNNNMSLKWVQVYCPKSHYQAGLCMDSVYGSIRCDMTSQKLKSKYISSLTTLKDNIRLWKGLDLLCYNSDVEYKDNKKTLQKLIDTADSSQKFQACNYCLGGSRDEIIKYLKNNDLVYIYIDKVDLSNF